MRTRAPWLRALLALLLATSYGATRGSETAPLRIEGSTTLFPVAESWVAGFRGRYPEAPVKLQAGGTTAGLAALIDGGADLALASRPLRAEEESRASERGVRLRRIEVARDALAVLVHRGNPIAELTTAQLRGLFTGELSAWDAVGGPARPVTVVARNPESHTGQFFRRQALEGRPFAAGSVLVPDRATMIARVSTEPWAIGFAGLADAINSEKRELVKLVRLVFDEGEGSAPRGHSAYAISRPLFFFARTPHSPAVARFVEFVLSPEGQALIVASNFFPLQPPEDEPSAGDRDD